MVYFDYLIWDVLEFIVHCLISATHPFVIGKVDWSIHIMKNLWTHFSYCCYVRHEMLIVLVWGMQWQLNRRNASPNAVRVSTYRQRLLIKVFAVCWMTNLIYWRTRPYIKNSCLSHRIMVGPGYENGINFLILLYYPWKIVCNTMLHMIFQYGWGLIQQISIGFEGWYTGTIFINR